jgi:hypothetical protein
VRYENQNIFIWLVKRSSSTTYNARAVNIYDTVSCLCNAFWKRKYFHLLFKTISPTTYLQRRRCENLQHRELPSAFWKLKYFLLTKQQPPKSQKIAQSGHPVSQGLLLPRWLDTREDDLGREVGLAHKKFYDEKLFRGRKKSTGLETDLRFKIYVYIGMIHSICILFCTYLFILTGLKSGNQHSKIWQPCSQSYDYSYNERFYVREK